MKKVWIIALSVVVVIIGLLVLLSFTLFSLKDVTIDFRTSIEKISLTKEEIIEKGDFSYGSSVFFHGKNDYIENIEDSDPYIKVINIETVFPSKFVIHIAERQEIFAIDNSGEFLICDDDFKVLRKVDSFSSSQDNPILLSGIQITNEVIEIGDFLNVENFVNIYSVLYGFNYPLGQQKSIIEQINFMTIYDDVIKQNQLAFEMKMFNGQTYLIKNCNYGLKAKLKLFTDVYAQIFTYIGKEINDGHILTEEDLKTCTIEIKNYYDYTSHGEDDCYFDIILKNNN